MCTKQEYLQVFSKCASILRPDLQLDDLTEMLKDEFEADAKRKARKQKKVKNDEEGEDEPEEKTVEKEDE